MTDNVNVFPSDHVNAVSVATDDIAGVHYPIYKVAYGADGSQTPVDATNPLPVGLPTDGPNFDAFARLRVSNPETIFDSKQIHNKQPLFWDDVLSSGSGGASTWTQAGASTTLTVADTTACYRIRQTFRRFNYQPGKSQLIFITGTLQTGGSGAGLQRGMGLIDDDNGFALFDDAGDIKLIKRNAGSETEVAQASWNIDPMDGSGSSGVTLDFTKSQIFLIDFEWLGVGRARCGFVIDGIPVYCHEFLQANYTAGVYMSTPNLPLRYWIDNDGTGGAAGIEHICCSVISEGGTQDIGINRSYSTNPSYVNTDANTNAALIGIRLNSSHPDGVVKIDSISLLGGGTTDYEWSLIFNPDIASTAPTWNQETNSVVDIGVPDLTGASSNAVTNGTRMAGGYVKGGKESGAVSASLDTSLQLGVALDGTSDEIWLCIIGVATSPDVYGIINWKEIS